MLESLIRQAKEYEADLEPRLVQELRKGYAGKHYTTPCIYSYLTDLEFLTIKRRKEAKIQNEY